MVQLIMSESAVAEGPVRAGSAIQPPGAGAWAGRRPGLDGVVGRGEGTRPLQTMLSDDPGVFVTQHPQNEGE